MPRKYTIDPITTQDTIFQLRFLRRHLRYSCTFLLPTVFTSFSKREDYLLHLLQYWGVDTSHIKVGIKHPQYKAGTCTGEGIFLLKKRLTSTFIILHTWNECRRQGTKASKSLGSSNLNQIK